MVEALGAVGVVAYGLASIVVGVRCLMLASATKTLPEFAIGTGLVVGVLIGFVPENIVQFSDSFSKEMSVLLLSTASVAIRVTAMCVVVFTVAVFRKNV